MVNDSLNQLALIYLQKIISQGWIWVIQVENIRKNNLFSPK